MICAKSNTIKITFENPPYFLIEWVDGVFVGSGRLFLANVLVRHGDEGSLRAPDLNMK